MSDYSRIIDHPHHQSNTRPHMSMTARAAQFSPFAALTGYEDLVEEAGRLSSENDDPFEHIFYMDNEIDYRNDD